MIKTTVEHYIDIARSTGIFHTEEQIILREVLEDFFMRPDINYHLISEDIPQRGIVGFILFGRTPMTAFTWDVYWIIVDKNHHGKGIGRKMMLQVERSILSQVPEGIIRVETSTRREYAVACDFYRKLGFIQVGLVPHFYGIDDDLVIFYKKIGNNQKGV